jgi:hypothetical protein
MTKRLKIPKGLLFMASDYPFGIFKRLVTVLSDLLFMASDYPFGIFKRLVIVAINRRSDNTVTKHLKIPKG